MKLKLPIAVVLIGGFFLLHASSAFALRAEQIMRVPVQQRDFYDTDVFTGSAAYSYNIPVPKGTNDLTPSVSLEYSSAGSKDIAQYAGVGWQLNQDYVERDVRFTPSNLSDDTFKLHFQGQTYDLVSVASENRYHTKIESFLNIQKLPISGQNDLSEYWQVLTQDGTIYRFGNSFDSEQACNGRAYVYRWNLNSVQDLHANTIYYTYSEMVGTSYLSKIEYNNDKSRVVEFSYGVNPYVRQAYLQGCDINEPSRLTSIQTKVGTTQVKQFDLTYQDSGNYQQLLRSIAEKGSDGSALPATTYTYKSEVKSWQSQGNEWVSNQPMDVVITSTSVRVTDVNGDNFPDIVKSGVGDWNVFLNTGSSWNTSPSTWITGMSGHLNDANFALTDVTGDGLPDIIRTDASTHNWTVWRNTGTSWTSDGNWISGIDVGAWLDSTNVKLADADGDGLTDILRSVSNGGPNNTWEMLKNSGTNWATSWTTLTTGLDANLDSTSIRLADVNADGLVDIVRTGNCGGACNTWLVFKNTGWGWDTTYKTWIDNLNIAANLTSTDSTLVDVNGDGLPDIIKSVNGGGSSNSWDVLLNTGHSWETTWQTWVNGPGADANLNYNDVIIADANGDGLTDIIREFFNAGTNKTFTVWTNNGISPDILASVHPSQGGTISFNYVASSTVDNTGVDSISDLPFVMWLVQQKTVSNGMTGLAATNDVTQYSYSNGLYDVPLREFRGFGDVYQTDPNSSKKHLVFHQDEGRKGKLLQADTTDSQNNPYQQKLNIWNSNQTNGVYTVSLDQEKNYTYDGTATNPKIVETDYIYDPYGNVTKQSEKGDTSTSSDDRFTYNEFVYNPSFWIVNTPKHIYKNAADDSTKVAESWFYYDNNPGLSDIPSKGDLTKEVKWLDTQGGTNPTTTYSYDTYGNVVSVTDANSHTTTYTFGSVDTTHTYPDSVKNAKNQTTSTVYDVGIGNLLSKTDPNGFVTSYTYDVFGRISKEIKPYDSASFPTVNYQYFVDGLAPEGTLVSKRETPGSSSTLDTYTYVDGLNRTVQTRKEAEDNTKHIVVDTFYDPTGQIQKQTVPYLDTLTSSYNTPVVGVRSITTSYDTVGRPTTITNPDGTTLSNSYNHWVITKTNERGKVLKQYLNAFGKILQVDELNGSNTYTTTYTYNSRDELIKITDAQANHFDFSYDSLGRKTSQSDPDMGTWSYRYDSVGNLTGQIDNRGVYTIRLYDEVNRVTKVDYPTDTDVVYTYDGNSKIGTLTSVTDAAGTVTYGYDNRLRKTSKQRTVASTSKTTTFTYDSLDRVTSQTNPDSETVPYTFNNQGEIESVTNIVSNFDYNALGKITSKTFANNLTTNYSYNTTDFRLNRIQTASNAAPQVTVQDLGYTYDATGNVASKVNNLTSKTESFLYDDLDRLTTAQQTSGYNYAYEYNSIGNLTKFTNAGTPVDYTYGQQAGVHALTTSTESATQQPTSQTITFDDISGQNQVLNGQYPTGIIDWGSSNTWWHSAPWNLFTTKSVTFNGAGITSGTFTLVNPKILTQLDAYNGGSATTVTLSCSGNPNVQVNIGSNQVTTITTGWTNTCSSVTISSTNGWDTNFDNIVVQSQAQNPPPSIQTVNFDDISGQDQVLNGQYPTGVINWGTNNSWWHSAPWNLFTTKSVTFNGAGINSASFSFVNPQKLVQLDAYNGGSATTVTLSCSGNPNVQVNIGSNQLTTITTNWTNTCSSVTISSTNGWDTNFDNIVIEAPAAGGTSYTYDANGNMTSDGVKCYEYNEANQLKKVKTCSSSQTIAEYVYDHNGLRMIKKNYTSGTLANTVTSWTESFETKANVGGSTDTSVYYYGNNELIAKKNPDGSKYYYHNDHLGSTSLLTNSSGAVVEETSYDPWGEVKTGGTASKFLYTGQEKDAETGLHYYNARYYDAHIRRFTQPDDVVQDVYDPQSLNRYAYVRNNPLRYTDPTGHVNILDYNRIFSNPTAQNYNNVISQFAAIPGNTALQGFKTSSNSNNSGGNNGSSSNGGSTGGGKGYWPQQDKGGARDVYKPLYNYLLGDDIRTFKDPNSNLAQKGLAGVGIIGAVVPPVKGVKVVKGAEGLVDATKVFTADQAALVDLAKYAKRTGVSADDAKILVDWAKEVELPFHDIMTHPNREFGQFPHINIGPVKHIFIN